MGLQQVRDTCGAVDRFGAWPIAIAHGLRLVAHGVRVHAEPIQERTDIPPVRL
jgi:hypothetical protein